MYCPVCRDEYRPGFTRCATCEVDLVASLTPTTPEATARPPAVVSEIAAEEATANFCGFLSLDEARAARDKVLATRGRAEILIAEAPRAKPDDPFVEEYWLRVRPHDFRAVAALIGYEPSVAVAEDDSFLCSACGETVHATDAKCPGCGLGFDE